MECGALYGHVGPDCRAGGGTAPGTRRHREFLAQAQAIALEAYRLEVGEVLAKLQPTGGGSPAVPARGGPRRPWIKRRWEPGNADERAARAVEAVVCRTWPVVEPWLPWLAVVTPAAAGALFMLRAGPALLRDPSPATLPLVAAGLVLLGVLGGVVALRLRQEAEA